MIMNMVFGLYQAFALAQYSFYDASFAMVEWVVESFTAFWLAGHRGLQFKGSSIQSDTS